MRCCPAPLDAARAPRQYQPVQVIVEASILFALGASLAVGGVLAYARLLSSPPSGGAAPAAACACVLALAMAECSASRGCYLVAAGEALP